MCVIPTGLNDHIPDVIPQCNNSYTILITVISVTIISKIIIERENLLFHSVFSYLEGLYTDGEYSILAHYRANVLQGKFCSDESS